MTWIVGVEDPLGPNEQLHAVESSGAVVLARFTDDAAARCTLLSVDRQHGEIESVVRGAAIALGAVTAAVDAWPTGEPVAFKARAAAAQAAKSGAVVREVPGAAAALALFASSQIGWPPAAQAPIARRAFVLARAPVDAAFLDLVPDADARRWSSAAVAPSAAFVRALAERGAALVYEVRDDVGRSAAVIVGAPTVVRGVATIEGAARRYDGTDAGLVLRVGPSGILP